MLLLQRNKVCLGVFDIIISYKPDDLTERGLNDFTR